LVEDPYELDIDHEPDDHI